MPFLPVNQQCQSAEGKWLNITEEILWCCRRGCSHCHHILQNKPSRVVTGFLLASDRCYHSRKTSLHWFIGYVLSGKPENTKQWVSLTWLHVLLRNVSESDENFWRYFRTEAANVVSKAAAACRQRCGGWPSAREVIRPQSEHLSTSSVVSTIQFCCCRFCIKRWE